MKNKTQPIRVLFVLGSLEIGGVQSGIMNFAKIISPDRVKFDVLVLTEKIGYHEAEFKKYGEVYHLPLPVAKGKLSSLFCTWRNDRYLEEKFDEFLDDKKYDAVHTKLLTNSCVFIKVAKKHGVQIRVTQSHVDKPEHLNLLSRLYYKCQARMIEKYATHKLAVSPKAVDLLYGKYGGKVIKNPTISLERLDPKKYSTPYHEGINLIQIGTYSHRKNQVFSVKVLKSLIDMGVTAHLTFVGFPLDEPEYIHSIENEVKENKLEDKVTFLPKDADVPKLLSESDYMLIPSLREGLPNVALEAQAMGIVCFISDTVNRETDCGLCEFLSLEEGAEFWASAIIEYRKKFGTEKCYVDMSEWDNKNVCEEYIKIWRGQGE